MDVRKRASIIATMVAVPVAVSVGVVLWLAARPSSGTRDGARAAPAATSTVSVAAPVLEPGHVDACATLLPRLPAKLAGQVRRPVSAQAASAVAAYGDPPTLVACGVAPLVLDDRETVWVVSGVCWAARADGASTVWTTVDRLVPVRVTIPHRDDGQGQSVQDVAAPIAGSLALRSKIPWGCRGD